MNKYEVTYERVIDMTDVDEVLRYHEDGWTLYHDSCNTLLGDTMSKLAYKECFVYAEDDDLMCRYVRAFNDMVKHRCDDDGHLLSGEHIAYVYNDTGHYVYNHSWNF